MKTVSGEYTLSYLVKHPQTRDVVLKHLTPAGFTEEQISKVEGSLQGMLDTNMGGGIPYNVINALIDELNTLPVPLEGLTHKHDIHAI